MTDTSKEAIGLSVEALRKIAGDQRDHAHADWDDSGCIFRAADRLEAVASERDALRAQLQAARDEAQEDVLAYFKALEAIELNALQLAIQQGLSGVVHSNRANKAAFAIAALETLMANSEEVPRLKFALPPRNGTLPKRDPQ
ncbi:hypothetical protein [Phaeobacter piscinae]|uniref:hypothetical protein n=1 Tax=Phaeobacter piscinae TaxID=1580596 RepID=UPI000C9C4D84|nr:hypothetical protein [Phaeobacter piscinae]AUQ74794.1 hypothetical protein PhaeoP71_01933 [Phaeobacter piscinae]